MSSRHGLHGMLRMGHCPPPPPQQASARLAGFLKSQGIRGVLDLSSTRDISLMETAAEFCHRFRAAGPTRLQPQPNSTPTDKDSMEVDTGGPDDQALGGNWWNNCSDACSPAHPAPLHLPMLASACPG